MARTCGKKTKEAPAEDRSKERMLQKDFYKEKKHYGKLDNVDKNPARGRGFFTFPEDISGVQNINDRPFLVFYFDDKEDYETVRSFFDMKGKARSHPLLDSKKLAKLVRGK